MGYEAAVPLLLILRSPAKQGVSKDGQARGPAWFETRLTALLTMRSQFIAIGSCTPWRSLTLTSSALDTTA
jgi:hypothetical protein